MLGDTSDAMARGTMTTTYEFNRARTEAFCGAHLVELLHALAAVPATDHWLVGEATEAARVWVAEMTGASLQAP